MFKRAIPKLFYWLHHVYARQSELKNLFGVVLLQHLQMVLTCLMAHCSAIVANGAVFLTAV